MEAPIAISQALVSAMEPSIKRLMGRCERGSLSAHVLDAPIKEVRPEISRARNVVLEHMCKVI